MKKPGPGRPFEPGRSGNPGGRPRGVPNRATAEILEFARSVLERPAYRQGLLHLTDEGRLPAHLETLLYHYAYGKPKERIEALAPDGRPVEVTFRIGPPMPPPEPDRNPGSPPPQSEADDVGATDEDGRQDHRGSSSRGARGGGGLVT